MNKLTFNIIIFFVAIGFCFTSCTHSNNRIDKASWSGALLCDAETFDDSWIMSNVSNIHLRGSFVVDSNISLSGKSSIQLNSEHSQGFSFEIVGVKFLDQIIAKVWRYKGGHNSDLSISDKSSFYLYSIPTGKTNGEWEELEVKFNCYRQIPNDTLLIQCVFTGTAKDTAWFDDFSCEVKPAANATVFRSKENTATLNITLPILSEKKLSNKRLVALKKGILIKEKGDLVKAQINDGKKVKIRLKGDWPDHLIGKKWSMRIEIKGKNTWKSMTKFSIQTPTSRNMMNEWVFHQLLKSENILTTAYFYLPVKINQKDIGIMAIEEHFTQNLLQNSNKAKGPILKFNEDYLWKMRAEGIETSKYPIIEAAEVKVFSRKYFHSSPELTESMDKAKWLLYAHQQNLVELDSLFDVDLLAKYYAIAELLGASHSYLWHNTRYYYNKSNQRLEPIGFDANPTIRPNANDMELLKFMDKTTTSDKRMLNLISSFKFRTSFLNYLNKYSSEEYLNQFFKKIDSNYNSTEKMLQKEYINYSFPKKELYYRANKVQEKLANRTNNISKKFKLDLKNLPSKPTIPFPGVSVLAYKSADKGDTTVIEVINYYHQKIKVLSSINDNEAILDSYKNSKEVVKKKIYFFNNPETIQFTCPTSKDVFTVEISKYKLPVIK